MRAQLSGGLLLFALIAPAGAQLADVPLNVTPESRLWVEGTSTVRSFRCTAKEINAAVEAANSEAPAAVLAGTKAVRSAEVKVPAAKLECGNGTMNEHMRKALKVTQAPTIVFQLSSYELAAQEGTSKVKMSGTLQLGGTERPIELNADAQAAPDGGLKVTGSAPIKLSDYGLKAPSLMMGTMKVGDQVTVKYDLTLRP
jgi:polyisoprenoid-binding protein YceI